MTELDAAYEFSLVIATYGAATGLPRALEALTRQTRTDFEVIIVDQNGDDRIARMLDDFSDRLAVRHLRSPRGVSAARNRGIARARGRVVAFPDDDCWYAPDLLDRVHRFFDARLDAVGLSGRCIDPSGRVSAGATDRQAGLVTRSNVWHRGVSAAIFLRTRDVREVGGFDESLGLGAATIFQSGEETDLLLRLLARGARIHYEPDLTVFHPLSSEPLGEAARLRAWQYGLGMGRVLRKHGYGATSVGYHLIYPLAGSVVALVCGRVALSRVRLARTLGRLRGW